MIDIETRLKDFFEVWKIIRAFDALSNHAIRIDKAWVGHLPPIVVYGDGIIVGALIHAIYVVFVEKLIISSAAIDIFKALGVIDVLMAR